MVIVTIGIALAEAVEAVEVAVRVAQQIARVFRPIRITKPVRVMATPVRHLGRTPKVSRNASAVLVITSAIVTRYCA